jgi:hypothetical protein
MVGGGGTHIGDWCGAQALLARVLPPCPTHRRGAQGDTCHLSPWCPVDVVFSAGLSASCHCGGRAQAVVRASPNAHALRQGRNEHNTGGQASGSPISNSMCRTWKKHPIVTWWREPRKAHSSKEHNGGEGTQRGLVGAHVSRKDEEGAE